MSKEFTRPSLSSSFTMSTLSLKSTLKLISGISPLILILPPRHELELNLILDLKVIRFLSWD